jgi:hypothetical protein
VTDLNLLRRDLQRGTIWVCVLLVLITVLAFTCGAMSVVWFARRVCGQ